MSAYEIDCVVVLCTKELVFKFNASSTEDNERASLRFCDEDKLKVLNSSLTTVTFAKNGFRLVAVLCLNPLIGRGYLKIFFDLIKVMF